MNLFAPKNISNDARLLCRFPSRTFPATSSQCLIVRRYPGLQAYEPIWRAMQAFTDARVASTADVLWVIELPPVFTLGQAGKWEHVLMPGRYSGRAGGSWRSG